jgi:hypothetical protein
MDFEEVLADTLDVIEAELREEHDRLVAAGYIVSDPDLDAPQRTLHPKCWADEPLPPWIIRDLNASLAVLAQEGQPQGANLTVEALPDIDKGPLVPWWGPTDPAETKRALAAQALAARREFRTEQGMECPTEITKDDSVILGRLIRR